MAVTATRASRAPRGSGRGIGAAILPLAAGAAAAWAGGGARLRGGGVAEGQGEPQQAAHPQLPEPSGQQEERRRHIHPELVHKNPKRRDHQRDQQPEQTPAAIAPLAGKSAEPHQQREEQIELLLHPQRPGLGEGIEFGGGAEIIHRQPVQDQVGGAEQRPPADTQHLARIRIHQTEGHRRDQHTEQQGGQQAPDAAAIETEHQIAQAAGGPLGQGTGDHEARDHEEHIHPEVAAGQQAGAQVVHDHRQHRNGPQAIDFGAVRGRGVESGVVFGAAGCVGGPTWALAHGSRALALSPATKGVGGRSVAGSRGAAASRSSISQTGKRLIALRARRELVRSCSLIASQ